MQQKYSVVYTSSWQMNFFKTSRLTEQACRARFKSHLPCIWIVSSYLQKIGPGNSHQATVLTYRSLLRQCHIRTRSLSRSTRDTAADHRRCIQSGQKTFPACKDHPHLPLTKSNWPFSVHLSRWMMALDTTGIGTRSLLIMKHGRPPLSPPPPPTTAKRYGNGPWDQHALYHDPLLRCWTSKIGQRNSANTTIWQLTRWNLYRKA